MPDPGSRGSLFDASVSWLSTGCGWRQARRARRRRTRRVGKARNVAAGADRSRQAGHARLRRLLVGIGQLHRPGALVAGVDLEEAGTVEAACQAVLGALDGELLVARTHEGLP